MIYVSQVSQSRRGDEYLWEVCPPIVLEIPVKVCVGGIPGGLLWSAAARISWEKVAVDVLCLDLCSEVCFLGFGQTYKCCPINLFNSHSVHQHTLHPQYTHPALVLI